MSATSKAISGVGTMLQVWDGTEWKEYGEINDLSGPGNTRDTIDTTHLGTTGGYRTFIPSFKDAGEISFDLTFERDDYITVKDDFEANGEKAYLITFPDGDVEQSIEPTTIMFYGLVTGCPITAQADDKIMSDVTIKVSGQPSVEAGTQSPDNVKPTVVTGYIADLSNTSVSISGTIPYDGGGTISEKGIVYAIGTVTTTPTLVNSKTEEGGTDADFTSAISGLTADTVYYARAYAVNESGVAYGSIVSFETDLT